MRWYDNDHMSGWDWAGLSFGVIVLVGLIVLATVLLGRRDRGSRDASSASASGNAEQVLAERFARGEIDEDEYRQRLAALRSPGTASR